MKTKLLTSIVALLCVGVSALHATFAPQRSHVLFASTSNQLPFAERYVMDTLTSSPDFDLGQYQPQSGADIRMIQLVEYGFAFNPNRRQHFGLFMFVFNPGLRDIVNTSPLNRIQMATVYQNGRPSQYGKFRLQFLSRSTGDVAGLFYKFQIMFTATERAQLMNRLNVHERRYDISGIEFTTHPAFIIEAFDVGRTFRFSGFARNLGPTNAESTLTTTTTGLRTLPLDVHHTWYRTNTSNRGIGWQNQVNSVYFAVPNEILDEFGQLQRIMAEWWEFVTQPMIVTSHTEFYNRFRSLVGRSVVDRTDLEFGLFRNWQSIAHMPGYWSADWTFNEGAIRGTRLGHSNPQEFIYYLFLVDEIRRWNMAESSFPVGGVSDQQLLNHILNYNTSFRNGTLYLGGRYISADLFSDTIDQRRLDAGMVRGHNVVEIDAGDTVDIFFYEDVRLSTWWERLWGAGRHQLNELTDRTIAPIFQLPARFPTGISHDELGSQWFVRAEDVLKLREFHQEATRNNERVFLFRFAVTEYYSEWLTIIQRAWSFLGQTPINDETYMAQTTVFMNFNIITLTFRGEFGYYVIPVVSNPIHITPGPTPPTHEPPPNPWWPDWGWFNNWWRYIQIGFVVIVVLIGVNILASVSPKRRR